MEAKELRIIRIYQQSLPEYLVSSRLGLLNNLKSNGLAIEQYAYSSFGSCYFFEVKGHYTGDLDIDTLDVKPNKFNWNV